MDPKMDSGMKQKKPKYTFENLKHCELSIEQVIKIMDRLQGLEVINDKKLLFIII